MMREFWRMLKVGHLVFVFFPISKIAQLCYKPILVIADLHLINYKLYVCLLMCSCSLTIRVFINTLT